MKENIIYHRNFKEAMGRACRKFRQDFTDCTIEDVARDTMYTKQAVQQFEYGLSVNAHILSWYVDRGMPFDNIKLNMEE